MKRFLVMCFCLLVIGTLVFAAGGNQGDTRTGTAASIRVEVFDRGTDGGRSDPTNNNWTNWIKEKFLKDENINIIFVAVPRGEEIPALTRMMAAGDAPDICFTYTADVITQYSQQGGLYDVAPYVNSHMPDLKAFLGPDTTLPGRDLIYRIQDSNTGKLHAVPARRMSMGLAMRGTFIRKDWLDTLGLPLPATTQQFYDAMVAIKDRDPAGIGRERIIPFTIRDNGAGNTAGQMQGAFIDPNLSNKDLWIEGAIMQPGYKETIRFLNRMFNAGLIDIDFPLYNDGGNSVDNLIKSGVAGCYIADRDHPYRDTPGNFTVLKQNIPNAVIEPIDPFTNSQGRTPKEIYDPVGLYSMIPVFSRVPEAAMRYLNWLARFENRLFLQIGPEGITHDIVDGIAKIKAAQGLWIQNSDQNLDYTLPINGLDLGDPVKNTLSIVNAFNADYSSYIERAYALSVKDGQPFPVVPVTLTVAGQYTQILTDKANSLRVNAITCPPGQFDRIWDEGIRDYLASGGQAVIDERRSKYIGP